MHNYEITARLAINELHDVLMSMYITLGADEEEAHEQAKRNVCLRLGMNVETLNSILTGEED